MAKKKNPPPAPPPRRAAAPAAPVLEPDGDDGDLVADIPPASALEPAGEGDADAELAEALGELGGISGATITVNRVNEQGKEETIDRYPAREFDMYSIRDNYGPGTYWFYGRDGKQLRRKGRVIFAPTLEEQRSARPGRAAVAAPANELHALLERQAQQHRETMQMFVQLMTANRTPSADPFAIIEAASKLAAMNSNRGSDVDTLMKGIDLARKLGGDSAGGDGAGLIGFGKEIISALRESSHQPQLPAPGPNGQAGDPQHMMILIQRAIAGQLPVLIRGAQAATDPAVYAQLLLDQLPDMYVQPLLRELQKPEWFSLLVQVNGLVVSHQAWFEALRNEILRATSQEPPPAP